MRLLGPLGALTLLLAVLLGLPGPAAAQETDGEAIQGTLRDGEGEPVAGVEITVEQDGAVVSTATTAEDGTWLVEVPGPGEYDVVLDEGTLPEGVGVRDEGGGQLQDVSIRAGQQRTVIIALGEGGAAGPGLLDQVPQLALNGIKFGLIVAMTAIGLSLIFGTTGMINFAHGELVTLGAVLAWTLNASTVVPNVHLVLAAPLAIAGTAAVGGALEVSLWRPLRARGTGLIQMLVISIGLSLLLRHVILILFGGRPQPFAQYALQPAITFGPVAVNPRDLVVMAISVAVLVAVGLILQRTRIGKAMRAVADNRDLAESSGIDVKRVILFVWVLGGALAGFGGVLFGVVQTITWDMGFFLLLLMFAGVILGGLGTAYGAMVGSLVVGLVSQLSTLLFPTELQVAWALGVLILVLLVRPQGLLGKPERFG